MLRCLMSSPTRRSSDLQARIEVLERLAEGMVEGVDGAVARGCCVLGDALDLEAHRGFRHWLRLAALLLDDDAEAVEIEVGDRKSTRLNSSHLGISYAVL